MRTSYRPRTGVERSMPWQVCATAETRHDEAAYMDIRDTRIDVGAWGWTDPDVVAANRAGRMTPAQRDTLLRPLTPYRVPLRGLVTVGPPVGFAFLMGFGERSSAGVAFFCVWAGIAVVFLLLQAARERMERQRDLDSPRIRGGPGHIQAGEAYAEGQALKVLGGPVDLPPTGWYQMYWLQETASPPGGPSRWLLSVAEAPAGWPPVWAPEHADSARRRLARLLNTGEAELAANRAGQLTDGQRRLLVRGRRGRIGGLIVFMAFGLAMAAGAVWLGLLRPNDESAWARLVAIVPLAVAISSVGIVAGLIAETRALRARLRSPQPVERITGPARRSPGTDSYGLAVADLNFVVEKEVAEAFDSGRVYVAYCIPNPPRLLAAEPYVVPASSVAVPS
jgi:hypothetical protein